jgi:two-component system, OmpR family, phosphate regulon response regulator OmpR
LQYTGTFSKTIVDLLMLAPKILIIDDDRRIQSLLKRYLCDQGFVVETADDGEQMTKKLGRSHFDLIVLDWMLPGEDGLSICMRLSNDDKNPPIIMLTANGTEESRISGLEVGADDYMAKPFNPRELVARIHAVLRRRPQALPAAIPEINRPEMIFGLFKINFSERCLYKDNHKINLTNSEFVLLKVLADYAGTPLSRERLAYLIDGRLIDPLNRSIDIQISRLRRLLESDPSQPSYLQTVRNLGYMLVFNADSE